MILEKTRLEPGPESGNPTGPNGAEAGLGGVGFLAQVAAESLTSTSIALATVASFSISAADFERRLGVWELELLTSAFSSFISHRQCGRQLGGWPRQ